MSEVPPLPRRKDSLPAPKVPPIPPVPNRKNYLTSRPCVWPVTQPTTSAVTISSGCTASSSSSSSSSNNNNISSSICISINNSTTSTTTTTTTSTSTLATTSCSSSASAATKMSTNPQTSVSSSSSASIDSKSSSEASEIVFEASNHCQEGFKALLDFYNRKILCDLEIRVGKKSIWCHRVVLACVSNYFKGMFTSDMAESKQGVLTIHDLDEHCLQALITFAYTSKVTLTVDNVQQLLYASSILQMEAVAQACCKFMQNHLHPTNCVGVRNFAEQHGCTELVKVTDEYILEHFLEVVDQEEFCNMPYKVIDIIVSSPNLNVPSEIRVYEGVMKWVKQDLMKRRCYLPKLLAHVKLPLIPVSYLMDCVETEDLLKKSFECRDFLDEAKHYQMSHTNLIIEVKITERMKPRKSYAGVLFCVGGRGAAGDPFKSIECYNYRKNSWFPIAEMNTRRRHVGVCAASGRLYAIGGHDGFTHLNSGEVFDPVKNKWSYIAPMGSLRRGIALACLGGPIYAIGGLDDTSCFNTVERYDPSTDVWTFLSSMKVPRGGVGVTSQKGYLYAVGGNDGSTSLDSCERYNPLTNKWTTIAYMNKRRAGAGVTVLNGMVYAVGGFDDNAPLHSMERYDPASDSWTLMPSMSCCRGGVGVATLGGKIFAVGGHDGSSYLNSVEAFDPSTGKWMMMSNIEVCRAGAGVAVLDCSVEQLEDIRKTVNTSSAAVRL
ncbi:kelch-like protein 8 [Octopus bimaculoides]|uniref:kelch-like protein 8 n=1 Tax=Octopus bimaculoides TaxID=37653 RepID=UPI00071E2487|nr:kelch-like protein 8 [Octopus bimaculoides]|eukprot:XP_014768243.1 PREDICTED: kelch-like protein 8 isoform X2 [Octopus bimaculoides]